MLHRLLCGCVDCVKHSLSYGALNILHLFVSCTIFFSHSLFPSFFLFFSVSLTIRIRTYCVKAPEAGQTEENKRDLRLQMALVQTAARPACSPSVCKSELTQVVK